MNDEHAAYCLVFTGEGVSIVRLASGFAEAVEIVRHEIWMDGDAPPDEWAEWLSQLHDESQWEHHEGRDYRFRFATDLGETGSLTIYRVEDTHPTECMVAEESRFKAEVERSTRLAEEVASVLIQLDGLAEVWGDEGVFRRCRDRLRAAIAAERMVGR